MRRRAVLLGLLACWCAGLALAGVGAAVEKPRRSALEGVAALDQPVTYTETKIPLGELVQKVSDDTGVPLTAAKDVADEPVAVVVKEFPARELLEQLADLLDYLWSRRSGADAARERRGAAGTTSPPHHLTTPPAPTPQHPNTSTPRFEIWQDLASKQREEARRRQASGAVEARFRQEIRRYVEIARLPQEQLQAIWDAHLRRVKEILAMTPEQLEVMGRSPEQRERGERARAVSRLWSPITRAMASLVGRLTEAQRDLLRGRGWLTFSSEPRAGELRMPGEIERVLRSSQPGRLPPSAYIISSTPEGEELHRRSEKVAQDQWAAATGYRVRIRLEESLLSGWGTLRLNAEAEPVRSGAPKDSPFFGAVDTRLFLNTQVSDTIEREQYTREQQAALEKDPVVGTRATFKPRAALRAAGWTPMARPQWWLRDLLPDLARTYGVDFISDAYWNVSPVWEIASGTEPIALFRLLDRYALYQQNWERRGRLIRLRSRTWFFDRPREIPLRLIRHWQESLAQQGALPLEEYGGRIAALSDGQLESLPYIAGDAGLPPEFARLHRTRHALRLYAALAPVQRQALWRGETLPVAQMTPAQRTLFVAALAELGRDRPTPPTPEQAIAGSLSLASARGEVARAPSEATGDGARRSTPPHPDAGATRSPPPPAPQPGASGTRSGAAGRPGGTAPPIQRYPVIWVRLHLAYGVGLGDTVFLCVAPP